ncbi:DsbA family protein [Dichotomicrobium thermohalophilum]|uniref:Protein-disulfide isomerase n=1 Tax=Dichotomicrobium thermohalophilum TaxID=933063 RepID=A0A397Q505_9HYPH|nr:DsbA family protein [Dichotomicrobium thermohalophilum]RIA56406.1 protein-disulfide isomerase [Dichotomicrobium thermohalophilum]
MTKSRSKAQFVFRPAVAVAGLSVLGVIMLSALHEVSAPGVIAREAGKAQTEAMTTELATPAANESATAAQTETPEPAAPADSESGTAGQSDAPEPAAEEPTRVAEAQTNASEADASGQKLDDIVLGDPEAPVTVIEYASMTCPHCASFHTETLPDLKEQYIDTGKVKFILREFPLDNLAAAASLLARCVEEDKFYDFVDVLFEKQSQWANADDPLQELRQISKVAGFTEARFNSCLRDQEKLDYIQQVRDTGNHKYDIRSTPTLIVNGQKLEGNQSISALQQVIDPMLDDAEES